MQIELLLVKLASNRLHEIGYRAKVTWQQQTFTDEGKTSTHFDDAQ